MQILTIFQRKIETDIGFEKKLLTNVSQKIRKLNDGFLENYSCLWNVRNIFCI